MRSAISLTAGLLLAGCVSPPPPYDYGPYLAHMPRSILVIPPLNEAPEVDASYSFLSVISAPIAERGYYVFPVAVVDELMKQNGCPTPGEMHQIPPEKLREVFGADAVLYLTVKDWGTAYRILDSATTVSVTGRLVDLRTGDEFWANKTAIQQSSSEGQRDIVAMLVVAVVNQVVASATDPAHKLAPVVAGGLVANTYNGMLLGPYHAGYAQDQATRRAAPAGGKAEPATPSAPAAK